MAKHSTFGHGFIEITFVNAADASRTQHMLRDYSHTTSSPPAKQPKTLGIKIMSVDLMEDPDSPLDAAGLRPGGRTLLIDVETNPDPIGSSPAHDKLHALTEEIFGLAQAPGARKHLCCISDM